MNVRSLRKEATPMGLTYTRATVEALDRANSPVEARFLIDTGAIDCLLPASVLDRAGIQPEGKALYELADGRTIELSFGRARIRFAEGIAVAKVILGPEGSEPILGAIALEDAGFAVDPATQTLKRLATRSLKKLPCAAGGFQALKPLRH